MESKIVDADVKPFVPKDVFFEFLHERGKEEVAQAGMEWIVMDCEPSCYLHFPRKMDKEKTLQILRELLNRCPESISHFEIEGTHRAPEDHPVNAVEFNFLITRKGVYGGDFKEIAESIKKQTLG